MNGVWTTRQVKEAEQILLDRLPEGVLMRRAAYGLAVLVRLVLRTSGAGRRVTLLVGAGNNGGDALWAGYELRRRGHPVTAVLLAPDRAHPAGLAALRRVHGRIVPVSAPGGLDAARAAVTGAHVVVDGIVGISGSGPLREPAAELVAAAEDADVPIVAVDLPSGVDPDTGAVDGPAVTAVATATFGALKPVHVLAAPRCGFVDLVDIGLDPVLGEPYAAVLTDADVGDIWPIPGPADDKYSQGVAGIAAGSAVYPGAAVLACGAAALATSGMVRYAGAAIDWVRGRWPEVVAAESVDAAGRTQAWTVGPGIGTDDEARDVVAAVLDRDVPLCIDADAITLLAKHGDLRERVAGKPIVITPHAGEFARIAGEVGPDRIASARWAATALGVTVLLKGNVTVIAGPDGKTFVNPAPNSWAATAGSGDVLSGIIGALLAAGLEPLWAAGAAAHVHTLAATLAAGGEQAVGVPTPASSLQLAIPEAIRTVRAAAGAVPG